MYFHGIDFIYLKDQYPFLYPESHVSTKKRGQIEDREHLIERFGLEPVHLLESTLSYPLRKCLKECFSFGDVVLAYRKLGEPVWQLSRHEVGVSFLDVRGSQCIFIQDRTWIPSLKALLPSKPIIYVR